MVTLQKKRFLFIFATLFIFFISFPIISSATIQDSLNLNIQVTNGTGTPIAGPVAYSVQFNLSENIDCSAEVYSVSDTVTTNDVGRFTFILNNLSNISFQEQMYLSYERSGILQNCTRIARSAYAFTTKNISWEGIIGRPDQDLNTTSDVNFNAITALQSINVGGVNVCLANGTSCIAGGGDFSFSDFQASYNLNVTNSHPLFNNITVNGTMNVTNQSGTYGIFIDENAKVGIGTATNLLDELTIEGAVDIRHTAIISDDHALEIEVDAAGFGDVKGLFIDFISGAIGLTDDEEAIFVNIDKSASLGGDIAGLEIVTTEGAAEVHGYTVGVEVHPVEQLSGIFSNMDTALNNGVDARAAFISGATNVSMFVSNGDTVTIGNTVMFEELEFLLDTFASGVGIQPAFYYSTGLDMWAEFSPADGTNGMRDTGVIIWLDSDIPLWANNGTEFLIRINRTRASLATVPIEEKVQIASATEYFWDKNAYVSVFNITVEDDVCIAGGNCLSTVSGGASTNVFDQDLNTTNAVNFTQVVLNNTGISDPTLTLIKNSTGTSMIELRNFNPGGRADINWLNDTGANIVRIGAHSPDVFSSLEHFHIKTSNSTGGLVTRFSITTGDSNRSKVGITKSYLNINGNGDEDFLVRLETDRSWVFKNVGSGATSILALAPEFPDKSFDIQNNENFTQFRFTSKDSLENSLFSVNGSVRIGTITNDDIGNGNLVVDNYITASNITILNSGNLTTTNLTLLSLLSCDGTLGTDATGNVICSVAGAGGDFSFTDFQASYDLNLTNIFDQSLNTTSDITFNAITASQSINVAGVNVCLANGTSCVAGAGDFSFTDFQNSFAINFTAAFLSNFTESFLLNQSNIFDQNLNTTDNVQFSNLTILNSGNITTTNLTILSLLSCTEALETDAAGNVICGTDATGAGTSSWVSSSGLIVNATAGVSVGIGTATPTHPLTVIGEINATTDIFIGQYRIQDNGVNLIIGAA